MWEHIRNVPLMLGWSAICSASVVGMLAVLLAACGIHVGWLLALLPLPPGVTLGVVLARSLGRQLLTSGADRRQQRRTARR
jgi:hypothetical protein